MLIAFEKDIRAFAVISYNINTINGSFLRTFILLGAMEALQFSDCEKNGGDFHTSEAWIRNLGHDPARIMRIGVTQNYHYKRITKGPLDDGGEFMLFGPNSDAPSPKSHQETLTALIARVSLLVPPSPPHYAYSCFFRENEWLLFFTTTASSPHCDKRSHTTSVLTSCAALKFTCWTGLLPRVNGRFSHVEYRAR